MCIQHIWSSLEKNHCTFTIIIPSWRCEAFVHYICLHCSFETFKNFRFMNINHYFFLDLTSLKWHFDRIINLEPFLVILWFHRNSINHKDKPRLWNIFCNCLTLCCYFGSHFRYKFQYFIPRESNGTLNRYLMQEMTQITTYDSYLSCRWPLIIKNHCYTSDALLACKQKNHVCLFANLISL